MPTVYIFFTMNFLTNCGNCNISFLSGEKVNDIVDESSSDFNTFYKVNFNVLCLFS